MNPPAGVSPMVVSIGLPFLSATMLAPLPRCARMVRSLRSVRSDLDYILVREAVKAVASDALIVERPRQW